MSLHGLASINVPGLSHSVRVNNNFPIIIRDGKKTTCYKVYNNDEPITEPNPELVYPLDFTAYLKEFNASNVWMLYAEV